MPTFSVRYDWHDKYIAAGCGDGTIRIFNVFTGKQSYILNTEMEEPMPTLNLRYVRTDGRNRRKLPPSYKSATDSSSFK